MALLPAILRAVGSSLNRALVLGFGYALPGLSSVKAVVHKDANSSRQLVIHFVILHLFYCILGPLFTYGGLHSALELPLVLWLSLPRFQGSLVIYQRVLLPILDRFEGHVDEKVDGAKVELWRRSVSFVMGAGWTVLSQIGEVVRSAANSAAAQDGTAGQSANAAASAGSEKRSSDSKAGLRRPRDPQHSVRGSLASMQSSRHGEELSAIRSTDETIDMAEDELLYVDDFLQMLARGLYVFAHADRGIKKETVGADGAPNGDDPEKTFSLRIFSYEKDADSFLVSSVDACLVEDDDNAVPIPIVDISEISESGVQGISIRLDGSDPSCADLVDIVLSDEADRDTLLQGLESCLFVLGKKEEEDEEEDAEDLGNASGAHSNHSSLDASMDSNNDVRALVADEGFGCELVLNGSGVDNDHSSSDASMDSNDDVRALAADNNKDGYEVIMTSK